MRVGLGPAGASNLRQGIQRAFHRGGNALDGSECMRREHLARSPVRFEQDESSVFRRACEKFHK
jgi:hypothetical protein